MSELDFKQRRRLEREVLPATVDDPEYAAATIVRLEADRDRLRARVAELEAMVKAAANCLCEQTPYPDMEHIADRHNAAVLEIRNQATAMEGRKDG